MLAFISENMSQKRKVPFAATDHEDLPLNKRSRTYEAATAPANHGGNEHKSLDLVLLSRPSRTRRMASVKASLLIAEHHRSRSTSPHDCTTITTDEEDERTLAVENTDWTMPLSNQGTSRTSQRNNMTSNKQTTRRDSINRRWDQPDSCASSLSPLSSLGSECDEDKTVPQVTELLTKPQNPPPKMKNPVLNIIPVIECNGGKKALAKQSTGAKKNFDPPSITGYVRRMASLNARACVSAMMEPTRQPYKRKTENVPLKAPHKASKSEVKALNQCVLPGPSRRVSPRRSPIPTTQPGMVTRSRQSSVEQDDPTDPNLISSLSSTSANHGYLVLCASPNTLKQCGIIQGFSEGSTYNSEGLLWNGATVHPHARVYFNPDGTLPHLIVPPVCPVKPHRVHETKASARSLYMKKRKRQRAVKGDNGWCVLGDPIKEVMFPHKDGSKVPRRYYAGIKRKNEELWVRDCITVKSGKRKQDKPFIAKIGSIWKDDSGSVMVTLFWYYRPEEAIGIQPTDFQEDELLASQHYDDNSVACIEDKCYVLGIRQYCRYRAHCKSVGNGVSRLQSFSIIYDCDDLDKLDSVNIKEKQTTTRLVFLCHRGYNHIAGRLLKSYKH